VLFGVFLGDSSFSCFATTQDCSVLRYTEVESSHGELSTWNFDGHGLNGSVHISGVSDDGGYVVSITNRKKPTRVYVETEQPRFPINRWFDRTPLPSAICFAEITADRHDLIIFGHESGESDSTDAPNIVQFTDAAESTIVLIDDPTDTPPELELRYYRSTVLLSAERTSPDVIDLFDYATGLRIGSYDATNTPQAERCP
jgi:hypothetical protein